MYKNDYGFIINVLSDTLKKYDLKLQAIGYDRHNADGFLRDLDVFGCPLVDIVQSARFLNDATLDMQLLIEQEDIEYDRHNELFVWSIKNAVTITNSFGEIKIDKENGKRTKRIDPVDACIDAHVIAMKQNGGIDMDASINKFLEWMG